LRDTALFSIQEVAYALACELGSQNAKITREFLESWSKLGGANGIFARLKSNDKEFTLSFEKRRRNFQKYKLLMGFIGACGGNSLKVENHWLNALECF
jgi:hypothetical protein